jgi:hypothetical protein
MIFFIKEDFHLLNSSQLGIFKSVIGNFTEFFLIDDRLDVYAYIGISDARIPTVKLPFHYVVSSAALKNYHLGSSMYDFALSYVYPQFLTSDFSNTSDDALTMYKRWYSNDNIVKKEFSKYEGDDPDRKLYLNLMFKGDPFKKQNIEILLKRGGDYVDNLQLSNREIRNLLSDKMDYLFK